MKASISERSLIYKKIIRGTTGTIGLKVATTALNMCIAILLARLLGFAEYGQYTLVITVVSFLSVPTTLGLLYLIDRLVIDGYVVNDKVRETSILVVADSERHAFTSCAYLNMVYHAA